jgi:hypothetical protein
MVLIDVVVASSHPKLSFLNTRKTLRQGMFLKIVLCAITKFIHINMTMGIHLTVPSLILFCLVQTHWMNLRYLAVSFMQSFLEADGSIWSLKIQKTTFSKQISRCGVYLCGIDITVRCLRASIGVPTPREKGKSQHTFSCCTV